MRLVLMLLAFVATLTPASAAVEVDVYRSTQQMRVSINGVTYVWSVSTGLHDRSTPAGIFRPQSLSPNHRSSKYNWAPMPWSVFYDGDNAIHGTTEVGRLGNRASHGCIRLHPDNARILFEAVKQHGFAATRIKVH